MLDPETTRLMFEREDRKREERIAECGSEEEWWRQFDARLREGERKEEKRRNRPAARLTRGIGYTILFAILGLCWSSFIGTVGLVPALLVFLIFQVSALSCRAAAH
jgi:hypothetical protein